MSAPRPLVADRLGVWSLYFVAKLYLYFRDRIGFDLLWNGLFFLALIASAPGPKGASTAALWTRRLASAAAAVVLLWRDSWLPSLTSQIAMFRDGVPSAAFAVGFLARTFITFETLALCVLLVAVAWAGRRVHLTWVVLLAMGAAGVRQTADPNLRGLDGRLEAFYRREARREVALGPAPVDAPPFDVVLLHLCSVSDDDLAAAGLRDDAFWGSFDLLLERFNTVSAHSTPAALRLMRAPCGQLRHDELYHPVPSECSLLERLRGTGYRTYAAHDSPAVFEGFAKSLVDYGRADPAHPIDGLAATMVNFDGSPVYDESRVLEGWWQARMLSGEPRAALYSNVVALHGGAHAPDEAGWWRVSRAESYRRRFARFAGSLARFEKVVSASGRRAVILVVPEHGAALRGSSMMPEDLRELPLPYITLAPVGVKFVGWPVVEGGGPVRVDKPVSYLALAELLGALLRRPPLVVDRDALQRLAVDLPETPFVAENQGAVVLRQADGYYLRTAATGWRPLAADAFPGAGRRP